MNAPSIHRHAEVSPLAHVGPGCRIASGAVIPAGTVLDDSVEIGPNVVFVEADGSGPSAAQARARVCVGANAVVHAGVVLAPGVVVRPGAGTRLTRPLKWLAQVVQHPIRFLKTLWPGGWSRHSVLLLVMQTLDNAIEFGPVRRWIGAGVKLKTRQDPLHPKPTYIDAAKRAAQWLQDETGGTALSAILEALANIPNTAHLLGGAVIVRHASTGVVDHRLRVLCCHDRRLVYPSNPLRWPRHLSLL